MLRSEMLLLGLAARVQGPLSRGCGWGQRASAELRPQASRPGVWARAGVGVVLRGGPVNRAEDRERQPFPGLAAQLPQVGPILSALLTRVWGQGVAHSPQLSPSWHTPTAPSSCCVGLGIPDCHVTSFQLRYFYKDPTPSDATVRWTGG